jgi:creatinine amidohydrolase
MTSFFLYENLTWPEVDALSRTTLIVLPLGVLYSPERLAEQFDQPEKIGILPSMPYGWSNSCLSVSHSVNHSYIKNLLNSLHADGFSRVYSLRPSGSPPFEDNRSFSMPGEKYNLQPTILPPDSDQDKVVIIPIGHTEQHAYHLPYSTDTVIIDSIAKSIAEKCPDLATMLPTMPYGVSTHRESFVGTFNAGGRTFEDFFIEVVDTLVKRQFTRFYFLNGHGGNSSFLVNVVKYVGEKYPWIFCATSWLYLSGPKGIAALEKYRDSSLGGMGHACELETSLMLYLKPEVVHMDRVVDETNFITTPSYYMDWVEGGALIANPPWEDDTKTGAYGAGSLGTAEKGRSWFEAAVEEKIDHIQEIHHQFTLRSKKRK